MSLALSVKQLRARYGQAVVLHGLDMEVMAGEVTAIVGANGAGKTSLMRTLAGLMTADSGEILCGGEAFTDLAPHLRVACGLVLVPEGRMIFPDMTVRENLECGSIHPAARSARAETMQYVFQLFPRLRERQRQLGGTLSGGEQQMLALGRGLMACPKILLLDEPTLGLAPAMAQRIFAVIAELAAKGLTVVLAEQDVQRSLAIASRAYVLEQGLVRAEGSGAEILSNPVLRQAYLGG